jgi:hypothetical protein
MELGVHLPLMQFGEEVLSFKRLAATVDAARECRFSAVSANDHLVYLWPLGDEARQLELVAEAVAPLRAWS